MKILGIKISAITLFGGLGLSLGGFFLPISKWLIFTGVMVIIDTITGVTGAILNGNELKSRKMARMVSKTIQYLSAIIVAHYVEILFVADLINSGGKITYTVVGMIATTEVVSIYENITNSTGIEFTRITDLLKNYLGKSDNNTKS